MDAGEVSGSGEPKHPYEPELNFLSMSEAIFPFLLARDQLAALQLFQIVDLHQTDPGSAADATDDGGVSSGPGGKE